MSSSMASPYIGSRERWWYHAYQACNYDLRQSMMVTEKEAGISTKRERERERERDQAWRMEREESVCATLTEGRLL